MLAEDETNSDTKEDRWLQHDPLLDSYTDGFRTLIAQKYYALHPALKTLLKFVLLVAIPVHFGFQDNTFSCELILASFNLSISPLSWQAHFHPISWVLVLALILSLPSLAISYLRDKNPEHHIPLKYTFLAILLTTVVGIVVPFVLRLLSPPWQEVPIIGSPVIGLVSGTSFGLLPLLFLVILPQIMQWVESLPTSKLGLDQPDDKSLNTHRLSYLIFLLLFFVPFMGIFRAGPYIESPGISLVSLFLTISLDSLVSLEIWIPSLLSMFYSSLLGIPRLFFAYRLIKFIYGLDTRKRALRMGILSVAWSLLVFSMMDLFMYFPPFLVVPIPTSILFVLGAITLYYPEKASFLFTERTLDERKIKPVVKPREEPRKRPEKITIPLTYVLKSRLTTSRLNIWSDREEQETATA